MTIKINEALIEDKNKFSTRIKEHMGFSKRLCYGKEEGKRYRREEIKKKFSEPMK